MFASGTWKPNNHFILQMLYLSRRLLSPVWSWFKMMTMCEILHSKQIKNHLNSHPNSQVLKYGTLSPQPLKEKSKSRWGGPTKLSVREITACMNKGTETASHPGENLHCAYVCTQHQAEGAFNPASCSENDHHQVHFLQIKSLEFMGESYELSRF